MYKYERDKDVYQGGEQGWYQRPGEGNQQELVVMVDQMTNEQV